MTIILTCILNTRSYAFFKNNYDCTYLVINVYSTNDTEGATVSCFLLFLKTFVLPGVSSVVVP